MTNNNDVTPPENNESQEFGGEFTRIQDIPSDVTRDSSSDETQIYAMLESRRRERPASGLNNEPGRSRSARSARRHPERKDRPNDSSSIEIQDLVEPGSITNAQDLVEPRSELSRAQDIPPGWQAFTSRCGKAITSTSDLTHYNTISNNPTKPIAYYLQNFVEPTWTTSVTVTSWSALKTQIGNAVANVPKEIIIDRNFTFGPGDSYATFSVTNSIIKIRSTTGNSFTIDANGTISVFYYNNTTCSVYLENLNFTGSYRDAALDINRCKLAVIKNCRIHHNNSQGISCYNAQNFLLMNSQVTDNTFSNDYGNGALELWALTNGHYLLYNSIFTGNSNDYESGGISFIADNELFDPSISQFITMLGCVVAENSASDEGGGINTWNTPYVEILNSIITNNHVSGQIQDDQTGGGIFLQGFYYITGELKVLFVLKC